MQGGDSNAVKGLLVGAILVAGLISVQPATAPSGYGWDFKQMQAQLLYPLASPDAEWDGTRIYTLGESINYQAPEQSHVILQAYEPATGTVSQVADLGSHGWGGNLVWDGQYLYILGGMDFATIVPGFWGFWGCGDPTEGSNLVRRYDPASNTVTMLPITLPHPSCGMASALINQEIFLFGGGGPGTSICNNPCVHDSTRILKINPSAFTVTTQPTGLLQNITAARAEWSGTRAYVFGGDNFGTSPSLWPSGAQEIVQVYDPVTGLTTVSDNLPASTHSAATFLRSGKAYLVGGFNDAPQMYEYGLNADTFLQVGLLPGRSSSGLVWLGTHGFLVGAGSPASEVRSIVCFAQNMQYCPEDPLPPPGGAVFTADLGTNEAACGKRDVTFTATNAADQTAWHWDFGDSTYGTGSTVTHSYAPGTFVVTLTVTEQGMQFQRSMSVDVRGTGCPPHLDPFQFRLVQAGTHVTAVPQGIAGMGGSLAYTAAGLPTGATWDTDCACMQWTTTLEDVGLHGCIRFTVTESPSGLSDTECLYVRVYSGSGPVLDSDQDGIHDQADNCPSAPNWRQADADHDGQGDACDATPCNDCPNPASVPLESRLAQDDRDQDGIQDNGDNCPDMANHAQADLDGDLQGDACDPDVDGDGSSNAFDACPTIPYAAACEAPRGASTEARPDASAVAHNSFSWRGAQWGVLAFAATLAGGLLLARATGRRT